MGSNPIIFVSKMLLSKIILNLRKNKKNYNYNKLFIEKLKGLIVRLKNTNNPADIYKLLETLNFKKKVIESNNVNKNLIRHIINIKFSASNTLVNVTDIEGSPKIFISSGMVGLKGKQKKHQPTAIVKILKFLVAKMKFLGSNPVAIHFIGAKRYQILLSIKLLKTKVFIKSIRNYNLKAYNGCRPRKMRRLKKRSM